MTYLESTLHVRYLFVLFFVGPVATVAATSTIARRRLTDTIRWRQMGCIERRGSNVGSGGQNVLVLAGMGWRMVGQVIA